MPAAPALPFPIDPDDPLADAHAAVAAWVDAAMGSGLQSSYWRGDVPLGALPAGRALQAGKPPATRRVVLAAVAQADYYDRRMAALGGRLHAPRAPWEAIWDRRRQVATVVASLLRRTLPLEDPDLLALLDWCGRDGGMIADGLFPFGPILRALERRAATPLAPELRAAARWLAPRLRAAHFPETRRLAAPFAQLGREPDAPGVAPRSGSGDDAEPPA